MRAGSAASRISESDLPVDRIRATAILHVSGISQAISSSAADAVFAAIDIAHDAKRLVSYDPNLRLKLWPLRRARAVIHEAMRSCDIALPGLDDGKELTGLAEPDAIVDFYLRLGAPSSSQARQGGRDRRDAQRGANASPRIRSRRSTRPARGIASTAPFWPNSSARRSVRRRPLRQCRRGALDAGLWRSRAAAAPGRGRSGARWRLSAVRALFDGVRRRLGTRSTCVRHAFGAQLDPLIHP